MWMVAKSAASRSMTLLAETRHRLRASAPRPSSMSRSGTNDNLVISATTGGGEFARIDWIEFTPVGTNPDNTAPFAPNDLPDQDVSEGADFDFDAGVLFADAEEDVLTFTAMATSSDGTVVDDLPEGVTFDTATGVFGGAATSAGTYEITVTASDGNLASDDEVFTLTVEGVNQAPELDNPIADQTVSQGATLTLDVTGNFSDPDEEDTLTYSSEGDLPEGVTFRGRRFQRNPDRFGNAGLLSGYGHRFGRRSGCFGHLPDQRGWRCRRSADRAHRGRGRLAHRRLLRGSRVAHPPAERRRRCRRPMTSPMSRPASTSSGSAISTKMMAKARSALRSLRTASRARSPTASCSTMMRPAAMRPRPRVSARKP